MPSDAEILHAVHLAFAGCSRPEHFTDFTHCEECAEHDDLLRSRDLDTLCLEDIGNPGWDPICFISPAGFAYYLPALLRLALAEPDHAHDWYGSSLFFHLCLDGKQNARLLACTPAQRRVVVEFLCHLAETRAALIDASLCTEELLQAMELWCDQTGARQL